ncbi:LysR substrate-binding domain-containing protein [Hyphomicrobium sp. CS1GBMeth3]|uniref:LysR family transcriptional regulator n=1 Tax=Hyphomicrobium sp. CS1GBMeth3 TaxID=1892845 RepID=UPI000930939E|nr:LysR substrate-binding domain-containing protein [Hyphomicrobium sp. CS1GBMeth3]
MARNIDIGLLRAFNAVVETGSVTEAAGMLSLTQAAVSQQIRRLEELFGKPMFVRKQRRLVLSPDGGRLLPYAQRLIGLNDETWRAMAAPAFAGEVRLGVPYDLVARFLPEVLRRFDKRFPNVRVSLVTSTSRLLLDALGRGELDLTLTTEAARPARAESLLVDQLVWVGAAGGDAYRRDPLPVSLGAETCAFRPYALAALAKWHRQWRPVSESNSLEPMIATLEADLAVAPMLSCAAPASLALLSEAAGLPKLPTCHVNLYLPRNTQNDMATELASVLREEFASVNRGRRSARTGKKAISSAAT